MTSFTAFEIVRALVSAFLYGALCGCIFAAAHVLLSFLKRMLLIPRDIKNTVKAVSIDELRRIIGKSQRITLGRVGENILSCIFIFSFGIGFMIQNYILLDGEVRLYTAFVAVIGALAANASIARGFSFLADRALGIVYGAILSVLSLLIYPFFRIIRYLAEMLERILRPIKNHVCICRSRHLVSKKIADIFEFSEKIKK